MSTSFSRYFRRFCSLAVMSILLTLFAVSIYRIAYVHRRLNQAAKYFIAGMPDRVARELRLAYVWSPAYTTLRSPVQTLYRDAVAKSTHLYPLPSLLPRSFTVPLPAMEKILIPFDFVADSLYRMLVPVQTLPLPSSVPIGGLVADSNSPPRQHPERRDPVMHSGDERMQGAVPVEEQLDSRESRVTEISPIYPSPPENIRGEHDQEDAPGWETSVDAVPQMTLPEAPAESEADRMWGAVTVHNAPLYNQRGARVRNLSAGSLVDIERLQDVSSGQVVHGTVWSRAGTFQNAVLRRNDVDIYLGQALSSTTREQRELVSKRAEIIAAIELRRKEIAEAVASRNPHHQDYRKVLVEYKAFDDEAGNLKSEFDASQGPRRMELANRLRVLKNEQQQLLPRYQDLKAKKEAWDDRNRERLQNFNPEDDPGLQRLRHQLMEIDEQINNW